MAFAMARKEGDALAGKRADADRAGRRAVARHRLVRLDVLQVGERVQAGAADDGECDVLHRQSFNA